MFDGLKAFWPGRGDMVDNLLGRIGDLLDDPEAAALAVTPFVAEIVQRLTSDDTVIGRLAMLRGDAPLPQVEGPRRRQLDALMRDL